MSLPFAAKCFKNVVLLCHQLLESATRNDSGLSPAEADADTTDGDNLGVDALDVVRQKALVNLAYVYLSMIEPQLAIATAKELLALPTCSKANRCDGSCHGRVAKLVSNALLLPTAFWLARTQPRHCACCHGLAKLPRCSKLSATSSPCRKSTRVKLRSRCAVSSLVPCRLM